MKIEPHSPEQLRGATSTGVERDKNPDTQLNQGGSAYLKTTLLPGGGHPLIHHYANLNPTALDEKEGVSASAGVDSLWNYA